MDIDSLRPTPGRDKEIGWHDKEGMIKLTMKFIRRDPLFANPFSLLCKPFIEFGQALPTTFATEQKKTTEVQFFRCKSVDILLQNDALKLSMIKTFGIKQNPRPGHNQNDLDLR